MPARGRLSIKHGESRGDVDIDRWAWAGRGETLPQTARCETCRVWLRSTGLKGGVCLRDGFLARKWKRAEDRCERWEGR